MLNKQQQVPNILSFLKVGDRVIHTYNDRNNSSQTMIVQIIDIEYDEKVNYIIKAPLSIIKNIFAIEYIDREKYGVDDGWAITKVTPDSLNPLKKPDLKII